MTKLEEFIYWHATQNCAVAWAIREIQEQIKPVNGRIVAYSGTTGEGKRNLVVAVIYGAERPARISGLDRIEHDRIDFDTIPQYPSCGIGGAANKLYSDLLDQVSTRRWFWVVDMAEDVAKLANNTRAKYGSATPKNTLGFRHGPFISLEAASQATREAVEEKVSYLTDPTRRDEASRMELSSLKIIRSSDDPYGSLWDAHP